MNSHVYAPQSSLLEPANRDGLIDRSDDRASSQIKLRVFAVRAAVMYRQSVAGDIRNEQGVSGKAQRDAIPHIATQPRPALYRNAGWPRDAKREISEASVALWRLQDDRWAGAAGTVGDPFQI
jgi:hypothetical protein